MTDRQLFIGIDPGARGGAFAIIDEEGNSVSTFHIPTRDRGVGNTRIDKEVDAVALINKIAPYSYLNQKPIAFIEMPAPIPGGFLAGLCSLFQSYGMIMATVEGQDISLESVRPATWKKTFSVGSDKNKALHEAKKLFPAVNLSLKKYHNIAEALLIAEYGRLKTLKYS